MSAAKDTKESFYVLGETLAPMLTNDMGSSVEIFDTRGPVAARQLTAMPGKRFTSSLRACSTSL